MQTSLSLPLKRFNSRTPGGVRLMQTSLSLPLKRFNSRTPGGVRRCFAPVPHLGNNVSIHAPREGCDCAYMQLHMRSRCFNSRTPGGVRRLSFCT